MAQLAGDGPPLQRLHGSVVAYCTALERDPRFRRAVDLLLFGAVGAPTTARDRTRLGYQAWLDAFEAVLEEAHDRGELREDITPGTAARMIVALTAGAIRTTLHAADSFAPVDNAGALATVLITGLTR